MVPARDKPILLFDVMGTLVTEPWLADIPRHLGMSLDELYKSKDPESWIEFEKGNIDEVAYGKRFFVDRRPVDLARLKRCLADSYRFMDGVEDLLGELKASGYEIHALSNYSEWFQLIEDKLALSRFLSWTFLSCRMGVRKPDPNAFLIPIERLGVEPAACVFVDDRVKNVRAAEAVGMRGILRTPSAGALRHDLRALGLL